jgi:ABC-type sugar transport system ATPase subunit
MRRGVVYLPADRRAEGLFLRLGVQQKVVLARGLTVKARVFVADEPTRGIASARKRKSMAGCAVWRRRETEYCSFRPSCRSSSR